jgi:H+/Cl- antiporter ClcA
MTWLKQKFSWFKDLLMPGVVFSHGFFLAGPQMVGVVPVGGKLVVTILSGLAGIALCEGLAEFLKQRRWTAPGIQISLLILFFVLGVGAYIAHQSYYTGSQKTYTALDRGIHLGSLALIAFLLRAFVTTFSLPGKSTGQSHSQA